MAEGGGLLNRYTVKSRIGGSNPPLSASIHKEILRQAHNQDWAHTPKSRPVLTWLMLSESEKHSDRKAESDCLHG